MALVLSRKPHESIRIGADILVTVVRLTNREVRLAVDAPAELRISREEGERNDDETD